MSLDNMIEAMDKQKYWTPFKEELIAVWKIAEVEKLPPCYFADGGSLVVNSLHIANKVGDGRFLIQAIYSGDENFNKTTSEYHDTGIVIFNDEPLIIRLYDCLPESDFSCKLDKFYFAKLMLNDEGDFLIACYV